MGLFDSLNFGNILRTSKVFGEVKSQTTNKTDKAEENVFEKNNESDAFVKSTDGGSKDDIAIKNSQEEVMKKVKENVKDYSEETTKDGGALQTSANALIQSFKENINNSDIYNDPTVVGVSKDVDQSVVLYNNLSNDATISQSMSTISDVVAKYKDQAVLNPDGSYTLDSSVMSEEDRKLFNEANDNIAAKLKQNIEETKKQFGNVSQNYETLVSTQFSPSALVNSSINGLTQKEIFDEILPDKLSASSVRENTSGGVKNNVQVEDVAKEKGSTTKSGIAGFFDKIKSFFAKLFG